MLDITVEVNGRTIEVAVPPLKTLLDVVRNDLALTGTKYNCEQGECGACTVLVDGRPVNACITLAFSVDGSSVETIESLDADGDLDPIQEAFIEYDAAQCGYCTPGMIMSAKAILASDTHPSPGAVVRGLEGNYCRCTGYTFIRNAVSAVATQQCGGSCGDACGPNGQSSGQDSGGQS